MLEGYDNEDSWVPPQANPNNGDRRNGMNSARTVTTAYAENKPVSEPRVPHAWLVNHRRSGTPADGSTPSPGVRADVRTPPGSRSPTAVAGGRVISSRCVGLTVAHSQTLIEGVGPRSSDQRRGRLPDPRAIDPMVGSQALRSAPDYGRSSRT